MIGSEPILPALKPYDWTGHEYALCRPLMNASQVEAVPWVGYGYNHPNTFEFISRESFPSGSAEDHIRLIEQAALRNLRERPLDWEVQTLRFGRYVIGWLRRMKVLIGTGDFLIAEHLLDPGAMRQAAKLLKTRRILVGVPSRGVLVATKAKQSKSSRARFLTMVSDQYYHARVAPISPLVFIVEDGQIIGALASRAQARPGHLPSAEEKTGDQTAADATKNAQSENQALNTSPEDAAGSPGNVYLQAIITADRVTGRETLHLLAGGPDFDQLFQALLQAFAKSVGDMLSHPDFSGHVRIVLIPELTPRAAGFEDQLARLERHFQEVVDDLNRVESNGVREIDPPLKVRVVYGLGQEKLSGVKSPREQETLNHENPPTTDA